MRSRAYRWQRKLLRKAQPDFGVEANSLIDFLRDQYNFVDVVDLENDYADIILVPTDSPPYHSGTSHLQIILDVNEEQLVKVRMFYSTGQEFFRLPGRLILEFTTSLENLVSDVVKNLSYAIEGMAKYSQPDPSFLNKVMEELQAYGVDAKLEFSKYDSQFARITIGDLILVELQSSGMVFGYSEFSMVVVKPQVGTVGRLLHINIDPSKDEPEKAADFIYKLVSWVEGEYFAPDILESQFDEYQSERIQEKLPFTEALKKELAKYDKNMYMTLDKEMVLLRDRSKEWPMPIRILTTETWSAEKQEHVKGFAAGIVTFGRLHPEYGYRGTPAEIAEKIVEFWKQLGK